MTTNYIVYALLDPRKNGQFYYEGYKFDFEPFYIGKGAPWRPYVHIHTASKTQGYNSSRKINKIRGILSDNLDPIIFIIKECLLESEALDLEILLIKLIGRKDYSLGPLLNLTNGGDGTSGLVYSDTRRANHIKSHWANQPDYTPDKHPSYGKIRSDETRRKIGEASLGRTHSDETRCRISETSKQNWLDLEFKRSQLDNRAELKAISLGFDSELHAFITINKLHAQGFSRYEISESLKCSVNYILSRLVNFKYCNPKYLDPRYLELVG